jgi:hypothetical protein
MNVNEKAYFYALDAIGQIAYSQSFDCLKLDKDKHGMLAINDAMMPIIMAVGNYMTFWKILQMWPFYLLMPNDGDECGFGAMIGYVSDSLPNRR